jgi:hypothetical protein
LRLPVMVYRIMFLQVATICFVPDVKSGQVVLPINDIIMHS